MRQQIYTPNASLTGIQSLADIGITTGAAVGDSPYSQDSVDGKLSIDTTKLEAAIASNPSGVKAMLQSWSDGFCRRSSTASPRRAARSICGSRATRPSLATSPTRSAT